MIGLKADPGCLRPEPRHVELALDLRGLAVVVVDAADVRDDLAGRRVDRDQRRIVDVLVGEVGDPLLDELVSDLLQGVVEGGLDAVAAGADRKRRIGHPGKRGHDALRLLADAEAEVRLAQDARRCGSGSIASQVVARASCAWAR